MIYHLLFALLFLSTSLLPAANITYLHPLPDSYFHSITTTIIVRFDDNSGLAAPNSVNFIVTGELSDQHRGQNILAGDGRTYIFQPNTPFTPGETVQVAIKSPAIGVDSTFSFQTSPTANVGPIEPAPPVYATQLAASDDSVRVINGVSVPSLFPTFKIEQTAATDSGFIFLTTYDLPENYWLILRNDGTPYFYGISNSRLWDFTVQANGTLTLVEGMTGKIFGPNFELLDTFKCGHGYKTDYHEFRLTEEGHVLLIAEDPQIVDMSQLVPEGQENVTVVGNHVQELDQDKNVIFEWRSWDHYNILDAVNIKFTGVTLHASHINAIDVDFDGNLLVSARHLDEITKINRNTGEIIWRLGGKHNEFTFVNDSVRFNYQHYIRAVPGKPNCYTLFDNGNNRVLPYSRAVEYQLDPAQKTATKVWEFDADKKRYSNWMGSVDRLPNGNTTIDWSHRKLPKFTEVNAAGEIVYELTTDPTTTSYRAHRHVWQGRADRPFLLVEPGTEHITLIFNQFGATDIHHYNVYADTLPNPTARVDSTTKPYIYLSKLINRKDYYFRVTGVTHAGAESAFSNEVAAFVQIIHPGDNIVRNGDFSDGFTEWKLDQAVAGQAEWEIDAAGQLHVRVLSPAEQIEDVEVSQRRLFVKEGCTYRIEFDGYSTESRPFEVRVMDDKSLFDYSRQGLMVLTNRKHHYSIDFIMESSTDDIARLFFSMGTTAGEVFLDNITLRQVVETGVADKPAPLPIAYRLEPAFPNPFNASTTIRFELPQPSRVQLTFYDILGREIKSEVWRQAAAGEHSYRFSADKLSTGIYFCRIEVENESGARAFEKTIKLMLIK